MKKLFFATVVAAMAIAVNASAQISVGVGYANETQITKEKTLPTDEGVTGYDWIKTRDHLNGFYVEAAYNWEFAKVGPGALALQPGLRYSCLQYTDYVRKGESKSESYSTKYSLKRNFSDHFIDMPIHVKYAYDVVPGAVKAYAFAGPVLSFGLACKDVDVSKGSVTNGSNTEKGEIIQRYNRYTGKYYIKTYNPETKKHEVEKGKDDIYKEYDMFDLKLALGLGVTVAEKVDIKFGYNIGLLNRAFIKNVDNVKTSVHSNILYFGAAYNF